MYWFTLALLPPLFFACSIIIDQFLARDYFKDSVLSFQATAALLSAPMAVIVFFINDAVIEINSDLIFLAFAAQWIYMIGVIPYTFAIQKDDASVCVPLFQITPILTIVLGYLFLNEILSLNDIIASLIVIFGAMLTSWNIEIRKFRFLTILYALIFTFCCASFALITRSAVLHYEWTDVFFWMLIASSAYGVIALSCSKKTRITSLNVIKITKGRIFLWNAFQELLDQAGIASKTAVLAIAPTAAHVSTVHAIQPAYVLIIGGCLSFIRPNLFMRHRNDLILRLKILSMIIIAFGLYLLINN